MLKKLELNIVKSRWILLLLFVIGYFLTRAYFNFSSSEYFIYNLLAFAACAVLFTQLKAFEQRYAAVWLVLVIIVTVYFVRFYWITIDPLPVRVMLPWYPYLDMVVKRHQLLYAFKLSVIAFATFCLCSAATLYLLRHWNVMHQEISQSDIRIHWLAAKLLSIVLVPLMLGLYYVSYKYHIGEMGVAPGEVLPYRLKGVVFYGCTVFIPLLILLLVYSAERSGHNLISRLGILLLMFHGVIDMLLRGSRGSMLLSMLLLVFLVVAGGVRLKRNEKILIGMTIMVAFIMVPVMTVYRNQRVEHGLLLFDALNNAIRIVGDNWWETFSQGIKFVLFRMPGVESIWCLLGQGAKPLGMQSLEIFHSINGIAGYVTYHIYLFKLEENNLLAPSFVGWFYLVAGLPAVAFGGFFAAVLSVLGWNFLSCKHLESGPVSQVFILWMLFIAMTEGTIDTMWRMVLVGTVCLMGMELGLRIIKNRFGSTGIA